MRKLLAKRPQPYYIYAPDYRRSSSGIRVLHMLCDALIRSGHEAYVTTRVTCADFMTPPLTSEVIEDHKAHGLEPIAVYPEIVDGNPINAGVVVRYVLNRPGFIEGSGVFADDDLLYAYSKDLLQPGMPDDRIMMLPPFDLNVFSPPSDPSKRIPGRVCYYKGRRGELHIDPALLPDDAIEITPQWPSSWEDMADLFQQCEMFYCAGSSALATEAGLCGCLTVVIVDEDAPRIGVSEAKSPGAAWGFAEEELERARRTLPNVRDTWLQLQNDFWPALDHFIEVTQQAANERAAQIGRRQLLPWLDERSPSDVQQRLISERLAAANEPVLGIVVLDTGGDSKRLSQTIKSLSLENQRYASVRILVLTTGQVPKTAEDAKLRFFSLSTEQPLQSIEQVLRQHSLDWFMLVNAGCEFTSSGLMIAALDLLEAQGVRAVYGDEVLRLSNGDVGPVLRPDMNLDLLLSLPSSMARHWLFNRQTWLDMDGFRAESGQAFELDYILRLIEAAGFQGLGHISEPLLYEDAQVLNDSPDERATIERHLHARGYLQATVDCTRPGRYELDYGVAVGARVSIIIPLAGDNSARIQRCMETLLAKTSYAFYEVLLLVKDNAITELQNWLTGLEGLGSKAIRVLRFPASLSPNEMRNQAAEQASGEFLLWLHEGSAVLAGDWLQQMLNHGVRQEVGAVGAKLLAGNKTVAEAGYILGLNGPVGKAYEGFSLDSTGYLQRLQVDQNYTALSDKCLLIRKELFIEAGGFDVTPELQRWSDADLCLRLHGAGFLNVFTPRAQLMLSADPVQPASVAEEDAMYARWLPQLARDPSHNPNFALDSEGGLGLGVSKLNWKPLASWQPMPRVLAHAADKYGCGHYRVIQPLNTLSREGLVDATLAWNHLSVVELERFQPQSIILQRQVGEHQIESLRRMKLFSQAFKVFELDDYLPNLPLKSAHRAQMPKDILRSMRRSLSHVDRLVVSTDALAEAYSGLHADIRVVKNSLDSNWWGGLSSERRRSKKPRVGWAGGASHTGDLEMIADVVKELADEVEWVFFGMCPDKLKPYIHEFHVGVEISLYPAALARLNLDLALAPVEQNLFNECKSNLRLLEYGACGFPVVCSDIRCYQDDALPVTRVKNRFRDWVDAIRMHLSEMDETARQGDLLRQAVRKDWMLEGENLINWQRAWLAS